MRCNYLHIWFIYSCRERPSIHFTLEEPNSYFDLKCNFRQSWSQHFGLNMARACAGWTKEWWEGEEREMGKCRGGPVLPQHLNQVPETTWSSWSPCPKHNMRPALQSPLPNIWPTLIEALTTPTLKTSLGFTNISQVFKKCFREIVLQQRQENWGIQGQRDQIQWNKNKLHDILRLAFVLQPAEPVILLCMQRPTKEHQIMA